MKKASYSLKTKKKENLSFDNIRYWGLCSYCRSELKCTFIRDPNRPVRECGEFEEINDVSIRARNQKNISPVTSSRNPLPRKDTLSSYNGLCSNCDEKATCVYPKPEGGVWRCDEYR